MGKRGCCRLSPCGPLLQALVNLRRASPPLAHAVPALSSRPPSHAAPHASSSSCPSCPNPAASKAAHKRPVAMDHVARLAARPQPCPEACGTEGIQLAGVRSAASVSVNWVPAPAH